MSMESNLFLQLFGHAGIPCHSRELAKEFVKMHPHTNIISMMSGNSDLLEDSIKVHLRPPSPSAPTFMFEYPTRFQYLINNYTKKLGYYIFEFTNIPRNYVSILNQMDIICTASQWGLRVLTQNGVKTRIEVIRGGVDVCKFNISYRNNWDGNSEFVFGHLGKFECRKNTELLIRSFLKIFRLNHNVKLLLSVNNIFYQNNPKEYLERKYGCHKNIEYLPHLRDIRDFYKRIHCAVFPTNAEGIGLPIVESMACGIPTIASLNSGVTEYAQHSNAILLTQLKMVPVHDPIFFPELGAYGNWESPTEDELCEKMWFVFTSYGKALEVGNEAARFMNESFSWKQPAEKLYNLMHEMA